MDADTRNRRLGGRLATARMAKDLTPEDVADHLDLPVRVVHAAELGDMEDSIMRLPIPKWMEFLGLDFYSDLPTPELGALEKRLEAAVEKTQKVVEIVLGVAERQGSERLEFTGKSLEEDRYRRDKTPDERALEDTLVGLDFKDAQRRVEGHLGREDLVESIARQLPELDQEQLAAVHALLETIRRLPEDRLLILHRMFTLMQLWG